MKIVLFACLVFAVPVAVLGAPAQKPSAKAPVVSIDPKARAIFARAVKLYSSLKGLSVAWTKTEDGEKTRASFDFDSVGRARVVGEDSSESLVVTDGKNYWKLGESSASGTDEVLYSRRSVEKEFVSFWALRTIDTSINGTTAFSDLLDQTNPLAPAEVAERVRLAQWSEFRATLLAPQPFGGPCDIVRISTKWSKADYPDFKDVVIGQETFWFARKDGRLMRHQERTLYGTREVQLVDSQIIRQIFNPKFAPDTFKFTPPQGAILRK